MEKTADTAPPRSALAKLAVEMGPLFVFFGAYYLGPRFGFEDSIFLATGLFMVAMAVSIFLSWRREGHVPPMLWVTGGVVAVMGSLTLILHDDTFIKMKPTIVNSIFALTIFGGLAVGRPVLKLVFEAAFPPIAQPGWFKLSRNWGCFFLFLALLNEVIWRNFSEPFWVNFKVWGVMPLTIAFALSQVPVMNRYLIEGSDS